jgi:oxygen-independent coproporphyrinogen-3 oxidase
MTGIYIHIPFCRKKCTYCDFASIPMIKWNRDFIGKYINAVKKNFSRVVTNQYKSGNIPAVDTIYIGGGTPSLLEPEDINEILTSIRNFFLWKIAKLHWKSTRELLLLRN